MTYRSTSGYSFEGNLIAHSFNLPTNSGAWAAFFRSAPQAVLGLSFWDRFRALYYRRQDGENREEEEAR